MQEREKKSIAAIPKNPYVELILQIYVKPYIIFILKKISKYSLGIIRKWGCFLK
jgi:hypothetical protein